ncbi:MAG: HAD-IA family hydrolase, partial [Candidatus Paceibacterota bacterium]
QLWFSDSANMVNEAFFPLIADLRKRGIGVYLATNNERYRTEYLMNTRGLGKLFDQIFASCFVGAKKPEERFYDHVFEHIAQPKLKTLYWDDDEKHIEAATRLGIPSMLYTSFDEFSSTMSI